MIDEIRAVLARHLPRYAVHSIARLGEGSDNVVYEVNGELIVRRSKEADPKRRGEATRREAELLAVLTGLSTLRSRSRSSPTSGRASSRTSSSQASP